MMKRLLCHHVFILLVASNKITKTKKSVGNTSQHVGSQGFCADANNSETTARRFAQVGCAAAQQACASDAPCVAYACTDTYNLSVLYTSTGCTMDCNQTAWLQNPSLITNSVTSDSQPYWSSATCNVMDPTTTTTTTASSTTTSATTTTTTATTTTTTATTSAEVYALTLVGQGSSCRDSDGNEPNLCSYKWWEGSETECTSQCETQSSCYGVAWLGDGNTVYCSYYVVDTSVCDDYSGTGTLSSPDRSGDATDDYSIEGSGTGWKCYRNNRR